MGGTKTPAPSAYGTLGVPSADNLPGNRESAASWTDSKGNLWLFGGDGDDSSGKLGYLNDLWEFNPSTDKWVWMGGKNTFDRGFFSSGVSGTLRAPAAGKYATRAHGSGQLDRLKWEPMAVWGQQ